MAVAKRIATIHLMLTISAFFFVVSSVFTSVWWACKDESANLPIGGSDGVTIS